MLEELIDHWWLTLIRGVLISLFGLIALFLANNMSTLFAEVLSRVSLVILFGIYIGLSSSMTLLGAVFIRHPSHRWAYVCHGIVLGVLCYLIFVVPDVRLETVILLTIAHAALNGVWEIHIGVVLKRHRMEAAVLLVLAVISLSSAALMCIYRNGPASKMTTLLGVYAAIYGVCLVYFGWRLRHGPVREALIEPSSR